MTRTFVVPNRNPANRWRIAASAIVAGLIGLLAGGAASAQAADAHILIYSGTVAHRHSEAITNGIGPIQAALTAAGVTHDWEDCDGAGTGTNQCQNANKNPRIFSAANLAQYDAVFFFNAGGHTGGSGATGPLWTDPQRDAIRTFVNNGGGIAANHLATDIGAGAVSWGWWDGMGNSAIGSTMPGHPAAPQTGNIQVTDRHHPSTSDLPEEWPISDEFYMFNRSVRGTHHVLMSLDENTPGFNPGGLAMGQDHPVSWCRRYDGGRVYANALGHYGSLYQPSGGQPSNLVKSLVGGVLWVAGVAGEEGDCGGTVWENFRRTTLATDLNGPIGIDIAEDGKVYWTEIGAPGHESSGRLRMYDPDTNSTNLVATILTRADALGASEDGVLGMTLDPNFTSNRHVYIYYSPRGASEGWPNTGASMTLGYNLVSRFQLNAAGTAVVSEQEILRIPKTKVAPNGDGGPSGATTNWPAHTGGAGMDFDGAGNLYIGVGDDVNPYDANRDYSPIDQRYENRYDARNTSANTNDLRGKVLRIKPRPNASGAAGQGTTYDIPTGNMFPVGTAQTKPEIYAMGFRQPFSVHADPEIPGKVVVGEYGPDAGSNNASRGPAGIIEWNHITQPGFYGWPFCTGDNSTANTYFRFQYPSGPTGAQFDCSLANIPNESSFNTGLANIPGPAVPATIWHKRDGTAPARQGIPTAGGGQEANSGPVYRFDPDNPSETKWPAYFDGSWIVYNRSQNWWRETKLRSDGTLLRANPLPQPSQLGGGPSSMVIPTRFGPDGSLYMASWVGGGRGDQGQASQLMRIDYVGDQEDESPPTATATVSGITGPGGAYVGKATLNIEAEDVGISGVSRIDLRINGGDWQPFPNDNFADPFVHSQPFNTPGAYEVEYRAVDRGGIQGEVESIEFRVMSAVECTFDRSDDFNDFSIDTSKWTVRSDPGYQVVESGGSMVLPVLWEVDGTATGPISLVTQQVPDGDWSVTTRVTVNHTGNWQSAGLMLWQSDSNFIKFGYTQHGNPGTDNRNIEFTSDNPSDVREFSTHHVATSFGNTVWLRLYRIGNTIHGDLANDVGGQPGTWVKHSGTRPVNTSPPREGAGVRLGMYAGGQQNAPWNVTAAFDFFEMTPDTADCPGDGTPPVTTATINGSTPSASYPGPVEVSLSATDGDDPEATGVDYVEYRQGTSGVWTKVENNDEEEPFVVEFDISQNGPHTVQYRSADVGGNISQSQKMFFTIGSDSAADVYASDMPDLYKWIPNSVGVNLDEKVTWHFDGISQGGTATTNHNLRLVRPGDDPLTESFAASPSPVVPGSAPSSFDLDESGTWTFYCSLHVSAPPGATNWSGMVGTVDVGGPGVDVLPPSTTASVSPTPPASGNHTGPVELTLTAVDGTSASASGVAFTEYSFNQPLPADATSPLRFENTGSDEPFSSVLDLEEPGTYTVYYRSVDNMGNREGNKSVTVTIQPKPPALVLKPSSKTTKLGKGKTKATVKIKVTNSGGATPSKIRVCATAPKSKLKISGKCKTVKNLAAGKSKQVKFKINLKPAAKGKTTKVKITATAPGAKKRTAAAKVRSAG